MSRESLDSSEQARCRAEERLQFLLDASSTILYTCEATPPYATTWISSNIAQILGYQPHEFTESPSFWASLLHPDDAPQVLEGFAAALPRVLTGEEYVHTYRVRHRAGYYCWMRDILKLNPSDGLLIGSWTDITTQRRTEEEAEQRVHRASALLRTMVTSTPVVLFALDAKGTFTMLEGRELRRLGLRSEQSVGTSALRTFGDVPGFMGAYRRALDGKSTTATFRFESATFEMFYAPTLNLDGQPSGMIGIGIDITEWHTVQRTLNKTEQRLTEVLRLARIGVWELDIKTQRLWWSAESYQIHGVEPGTPVTQAMFLASVHPKDLADLNASFAPLFAAGRFEHDFRIVLPSGELRHIHSNAWIIPNETGEPDLITGINQDITERKRADLHTREQANLLDKIFQHSLDSIAILDPNLRFVRVSDSYARVCARPAADLIGQRYFDLHPSTLKDEFDQAKRQRTAYNKQAQPAVFSSPPKRAADFWDLGIVPITNERAEVEYFLFTSGRLHSRSWPKNKSSPSSPRKTPCCARSTTGSRITSRSSRACSTSKPRKCPTSAPP